MLAAKELIAKTPKPSRDEIKEALSGNLCRCTGYIKIYEAVELAAAKMRGEESELPRESIYGL
jgi:aerobic-type carbon monoxide dehydrogenase small subunit (CoxS/CutS family)